MARILLVDDSVVMRRNLSFTLNRAGHEVVAQAADGQQAYNLYKMHKPDVVTMDITMPEVNGIEAVQMIIKDFPDAKIVMVSALDQKEMVLEALKYGAKHYIIKPINPEHLRNVINKLMGIAPAPTPVSAPRLVAAATPEKAQLEAKINELEQSRQQLAEDNMKLEQLTKVDALTGIPNRRHFDFILASEWKKGLRDKTPISLLMMDIDYFKKYNDSQGHLAGDECLKSVAGFIAGNLKRPSDIAARYGGEEFAVILPGTDKIGAVYVAEYIRSSVEGAKLEHPESPASKYVTLSIGVACVVPTLKTDFKDLIRMADEQLYSAKELGRNRVAYSLD